MVSKSGEPRLFTQKYKFDGDLRVSMTDSTMVQLKNAYALEYTLYGTAESGPMEIPFENIESVEEKHNPEGISLRAFVAAGLLVAGLTMAVISGT